MKLLWLLTILFTGSALSARVTNPKKVPRNAVLLSKVSAITVRAGKQTASRRVPPVPQLQCVGPAKICSLYTVDVMRCTNEGVDYDENNVQWSCKASLPDEFKLGSTDVTCEGYESSDDPYVLKGSCGVEYRLLLTDKGEEKYGSHTSTNFNILPKTHLVSEKIFEASIEHGEKIRLGDYHAHVAVDSAALEEEMMMTLHHHTIRVLRHDRRNLPGHQARILVPIRHDGQGQLKKKDGDQGSGLVQPLGLPPGTLQGEVHEHNPSRHEERRGAPNGGMDGWVAGKTTVCLEEGTIRAAGSVVEAEEVAPDLDHLPRGLPAQVQVSRAHDMRVQVSVERVVARNADGHSRRTLASGLPALELVKGF
ncbi:hypothetical protein LTR47_007535 [Exophiala xenobiotica]|nr:hypothetical protein LTR41_000685 [Exophiala xenobiotica]KAK5230393.1 hypothetical protein LTR47_007535 [Exophiala xenobiotica]KAK5246648.1 hypothetical protein LTS06_008060 [Exophiala xenobiotica]KAK5315203.1 hypothetical protein LTR93_009835 [Exophiala xenobiotica]KAK5346192.1 hypothetical protein LTR61_010058 [Exophiala xenobiotica]